MSTTEKCLRWGVHDEGCLILHAEGTACAAAMQKPMRTQGMDDGRHPQEQKGWAARFCVRERTGEMADVEGSGGVVVTEAGQ